MTSPASNYNPHSKGPSAAYELLDPRIKEWIYREGWTELHDIQEAAILAILDDPSDVVISAATASGKTEAAFLPICSAIAEKRFPSIQAIYIGPLKALIDDQFGRLEALCETLDIPVHRWHGDISHTRKQRLIKNPGGILLITPESIEALFINRGTSVTSTLFSAVQFVVIDELHGYIGSERGRQLQSLLHRLETLLGRRVPRVALSATLGDVNLAADFLRPGQGKNVTQIISSSDGAGVKLQVRGYVELLTDSDSYGAFHQIAEHLFSTLRGSDNLIFPNRRSLVEQYADKLRSMCEDARIPNEFWPHHGNLSRELRSDAESRLKQREQPINVVCTSTLELGIDIGCVKSIAQIGVPPSVSSPRQRMGRSGRRGDIQTLRIYITESELSARSGPTDALRQNLVQSIALVNLMLKRWCEPPRDSAYHFSTLVQQTLSLLAQYGGATAIQIWQVLCATGPFSNVTQTTFALFLRSLASNELLKQCDDGLLILDVRGERLINHYDFYTAFTTPDEYRLYANGKNLGTLPILYPITPGAYLTYAGKRWMVLSVDDKQRVIDLKPATAGLAPKFGGDGFDTHSAVRCEMLDVYRGSDTPAYLDSCGRDLLREARDSFTRFQLSERPMIQNGEDTLLFHWSGDREARTLGLMLEAKGFQAEHYGMAIAILKLRPEAALAALEGIMQSQLTSEQLANLVKVEAMEKHDCFLPEDLLRTEYVARFLDISAAEKLLHTILTTNRTKH